MTLNTRPPTGAVPFPFVLAEGVAKAGKSYALAELAGDERIGRALLFDLEGSLDEYAPLGDYELVESDGTWTGFLGQLEEAMAVPMTDGRPNLIGLDSGSRLWDQTKGWVTLRARRSRAGRRALADDPDAPLRPSMDLWNDAADRWGDLMARCSTYRHGVVVMTAKGAEVAEVDDGGPVKGSRVWSVDAHKSTVGEVTAHVRWTAVGKAPRLVGVRSLSVEVPDGGMELPRTGSLAHVVFNVLGAGAAGFAPRQVVRPRTDDPAAELVPVAQAKARVLRAAGDDKAKAARVWTRLGLPTGKDATVTPDQLVAALDAVDDDDDPGDGGPAPDPAPDNDSPSGSGTPAPSDVIGMSGDNAGAAPSGAMAGWLAEAWDSGDPAKLNDAATRVEGIAAATYRRKADAMLAAVSIGMTPAQGVKLGDLVNDLAEYAVREADDLRSEATRLEGEG